VAKSSCSIFLGHGNQNQRFLVSATSCFRHQLLSRPLLLPSSKILQNSKRTIMSSNPDLNIFGSSNKEDGIIQRIKNKMGFTETPKSVLLASGYFWYIKVADEVNYKHFFEICELEDTFSSWFYVMELHVWLLAARLMDEGEQGRVVRNSMLKAMWEDVDVRSKKLEGALSSARRAQIVELNEQFQASLLSYDEGLLGNDKILAGALWRRFQRGKNPKNDEELLKQIIALEMLVIYVREQFFELSKMSKHQLFLKREITWTPFTKNLLDLVDKKPTGK